MLKKLIVRNFGKHKRKVIRFDPKITCLVGPSYSGKSTILRALRWVMLNKPAGNRFIKWDAKTTKVILDIDDDRVIRQRGKTNTYTLRTPKEELGYAAFGNDVPQTIQQIINVGEDNFQRQHDSPFWFADSAGEVNRKLNNIVSLGLIDTTLKNIAGKQRNNNAEITVLENRVRALVDEKLELSPILKAKKELDRLTTQAKKINRATTDLSELETLVAKVQQNKKACKKPPSFDSVDNAKEELKQARNDLDDLSNLIFSINNSQRIIKQWREQWLQKRKQLTQKTGNKCPLCHQPLKAELS